MNKLLLGLVAGLLLGGCSTYRVLAFGDHSSGKMTRLETFKSTTYISGLWSSHSHQFWVCQDLGNTLSCERRCGDGTDLACPEASVGLGGITTNAR